MTDLEITKLCAEAMGFRSCVGVFGDGWMSPTAPSFGCFIFNPLHDDAQAMALVKKWQLHSSTHLDGAVWLVSFPFSKIANFAGYHTEKSDLNRAICECVAKMQKSKEAI